MRRILRKIASNEHEAIGDTSTLADPEVVTKLVKGRRNRPNQDAEDWVG
jgi:acetyl-CoA synthetase